MLVGHEDVGIHGQERFGVHRHLGKEVPGVDVGTAEPVRPADAADPVYGPEPRNVGLG